MKDATGAAGTNDITITPQAGETIDGAASYVIDANYGCVTFMANSLGEWLIISKF